MKINLSSAVAIIAATAVVAFGLGLLAGEAKVKYEARANARAFIEGVLAHQTKLLDGMTAEWSMKTVNR